MCSDVSQSSAWHCLGAQVSRHASFWWSARPFCCWPSASAAWLLSSCPHHRESRSRSCSSWRLGSSCESAGWRSWRRVQMSDMSDYVVSARGLLAGHGYFSMLWQHKLLAFRPPGESFLLAGAMWLIGDHDWTAAIINLICYVGAALVLHDLGTRLAGAGPALLASALFAIWPSHIMGGGLANSEMPILSPMAHHSVGHRARRIRRVAVDRDCGIEHRCRHPHPARAAARAAHAGRARAVASYSARADHHASRAHMHSRCARRGAVDGAELRGAEHLRRRFDEWRRQSLPGEQP